MDQQRADELREKFKQGYFLEAQIGRVRALDMETFPPRWITRELQDALDEIKGPHNLLRKKRVTVLRVAESAASGTPIRAVFNQPDTCNSSTWYSRRDKATGESLEDGWSAEPEVQEALELATRLANEYYDSLEEARIEMRRKSLRETQDRLIELGLLATETLVDVMVEGEHDDVRRKAAVDVLTHAAAELAPKSQAERAVTLDVRSGPSMREIRQKRRRVNSLEEDVIEAEALLDDEDLDFDGEEDIPPPPPAGLIGPALSSSTPPEFHSDNGNGEAEDWEAEGEEVTSGSMGD